MAGFASFHSPPLALPQCGCFTIVGDQRKCLPLLDVHVHTSILSSASRTTLRQAFVNPDAQAQLGEVRYDFPLYDGVSVVGFKCSIGRRVITGVIKERQEAKKAYESAINEGKVAALLNQDIRAADVFTAALGNVPAGARVEVEITYLGELEHDAEADCLRLTIPTSVAPRYDRTQVLTWAAHDAAGGVAQEVGNMSITVDVQMARECPIANIQSPSHPISVGIGKTSAVSASADEPSSPQRASVSLALEAAQLDKDFVLMVAAAGLTSPVALVEAHPTIPHQQAVMATLVPRFNLPAGKPEIVFVCDRSGSMGMGQKIPNLVAALQIFLKSLPVGVRFNICSFGSQHKFLWQKSQAYNQETLDKAVEHVQSFAANFGGTEMYQPLVDTFNRRSAETNLEVFLLTDGEVWEQTELFQVVDDHVGKSNGAIRIFTLGVGDQASSALVKGVARAGNGFAQMVSDHERMDKKIIRMLKGALTPHIKDYALGITYEGPGSDDGVASRREDLDDDFEIVGDALRGLSINTEKGSGEKRENQAEPQGSDRRKEPISLFDPNVQDEDLEMTCASDGIINESGCLPDIELPRYLQTPYKVPALFPFSRTTVYVLLSDSKSNRQLKSVVLTGTSDQGPLRLEIPVTKTVEKGSTLHQLAARKAMQELEDDRGWPTQARDGDGKLLSKEFPGQFGKMARREAIRLGVTYQVSGKWCSFVAVQEDGQGDTEGSKDETLGEFEIIGHEEAPASRMLFGTAAPQTMSRALKGSSISTATSFGGMDTGSSDTNIGFGGMDTGFCGMATSFGAQSAPQPPFLPFGSATSTAAPSATFGQAAPLGRSADTRADDPAEFRGSGFGCGFGFEAFGGSPAAPDAAGNSENEDDDGDDALAVLASLQTFIGNWVWSKELEQAIGVTQHKAMEEVKAILTEGGSRADVAATLCAVLFLKQKLAKDRSAWELMVEKAERWLEEQTGQTTASLERCLTPSGQAAGLFG